MQGQKSFVIKILPDQYGKESIFLSRTTINIGAYMEIDVHIVISFIM